MKIPVDLSFSTAKISTQDKRNNPALNLPFFTNVTKKILNDFYPKYCPNCEDKLLTKEISTRPELIRCDDCRYLTSRLSYTPLHHFKLPMWMFGYVLYESLIQHPKVVTSTELSKRLRISYKAAALLKKRFQCFASDQLPKYKQLTFNALNREFKNFSLPSDEEADVSKKMENKPYVCADTAVLYSASERANQGRKRYRHGGATASIYLSDKLGGKQVGTLVHTIAIKKGPVFFHSVSNQKANTLGPIIKDHLPLQTPVFTDQGYPWLWGIYKNHRSVNHSAHSKDTRYRWARNRWSKNGVHNQVAEGNHRLLKSAFASYCYIRPENSTRYLNEFSFLKNATVFGLDVIREDVYREYVGECSSADVRDGVGKNGVQRGMRWGSFRAETEGPSRPAVGIGAKGFGRKKNAFSSENWLSSSIRNYEYFPELGLSKNQDIFESTFSYLNSPDSLKSVSILLSKEMKVHNDGGKGTYIQRKKELNHQKTASKIWNLISEENGDKRYLSVNDICSEIGVHKISVMIILRKWLKLKLIEKRRINQAWYDRRIDFGIKRKSKTLPYLLYTNFKDKKNNEILREFK